jgi:hypothetical protein
LLLASVLREPVKLTDSHTNNNKAKFKMKLKGIFYPVMLVIFLASQASGQSYTEIFSDGWGQGRRFIRPCFTDLDNNGLLDLLLGENDGGIHHLEQDSAESTQFSSISTNFNGIDAGARPAPTFTDLDNDDLMDLIIGKQNGTISHYEQDSAGSTSFSLQTENFNGIDIGEYATPRFIDLDHDDLLDLIVGEEEGTLNHYQQKTQGSSEFTLVTENFNGIDVGYISTPCFADLDSDELIDLIVGVNVGHLHHYEQTSFGSTEFGMISDNYNGIDIGAQACPIFTDVDDDGLLDLMIGDMHGYLSFYEQEADSSASVLLISDNILPGIDIGNNSAPSFTDLDHNGLWDMVVGANDGTLNHFEQEAAGSSFFNFMEDTMWGMDFGAFSSPAFIDLDGDGLTDMIVGGYKGNLIHYEQEGPGSLNFDLVSDSFNDISLGNECSPSFTDIDGDTLYDMIIGLGDGTLYHYAQDAVGSTNFSLISDHFNDIDLDWGAKPSFTYFGDDDLLDMIIGESGGALYYYKQDAIGASTFTLMSENFQGIESNGYSAPAFTDINGDGLEDLIIGAKNGGIRYFQRNDVSSVGQESRSLNPFGKISIYPNPFNSSTHIHYSLHKQAKVKITIYNIHGQKVRILDNSFKRSGSHMVQWDGTDEHDHSLASGAYICCIHANSHKEFIKLLLMK